MENEVELKTRPLTAEQLRKILVDAHPRIAAVFDDEAAGLTWEPATKQTRVIAASTQGRLLEDTEGLGWSNGYLHFNFGISAKFYEGQPRLYNSFTLSLIKPRVVGFMLNGTERPSEPITRVSFEWGFITEEKAAALRELFTALLCPERKKTAKGKKERNHD